MAVQLLTLAALALSCWAAAAAGDAAAPAPRVAALLPSTLAPLRLFPNEFDDDTLVRLVGMPERHARH